MRNIYLIGGPNGAGKTTIARETLLDLGCREFINSDNIASGLSPFNVDAVAVEAGRLMLKRISELAHMNTDFAFESTLAAKSFVKLVEKCRANGDLFHLIYVWLESPELSLERVACRVAAGGHNIPENVIRRRYETGRKNLLNIYLPRMDSCFIYDNSGQVPELVFEKKLDGTEIVTNEKIWKQITG